MLMKSDSCAKGRKGRCRGQSSECSASALGGNLKGLVRKGAHR